MKRWMDRDEIKQLRKSVKEREELDKLNGRWTGIRNRCLIETLLNTGVRASELRDIQINDLNLEIKTGEPFIRIRTLKRRKQVTDIVTIPKDTARLIMEYLKEMARYGKSISANTYLFPGRGGQKMSLVGLEECVKSIFQRAGLPDFYSVHSLRHSHAFHLYEQSKNLKLVQLRLRHSSIQTSGIYCGVPEGVEAKTIATMYA